MGALADAIRSRDVKRIRDELARASRPELQRALTDAVRERDRELVDLMFQSLADPDEPAPGETWGPLRLAIELDDPPIIARLLLAGADVNRADRFGSTPLVHAVDVAADAFRHSPLPSRSAPDTTVVRMLLDRGADPTALGPDGKTALGLARVYEFADAIALFESRLRRRDRHGRFGYVTEIGDFILAQRVERERLRSVLAGVFAVEAASIAITSRVEDFTPDTLNVAVYPVRGDYEQLVSLFFGAERQPFDPFDGLVTISRLLGTTLLAPRPGVDPYAYWKIEPSGEWDLVWVDDESEDPDEAPIYRLMRGRESK